MAFVKVQLLVRCLTLPASAVEITTGGTAGKRCCNLGRHGIGKGFGRRLMGRCEAGAESLDSGGLGTCCCFCAVSMREVRSSSRRSSSATRVVFGSFRYRGAAGV